MKLNVLETIFAVVLFLLYFVLWKIKRIRQIKSFGVDPEVISNSKSSVQRYFYFLIRFISMYAILIIILHALNVQFYSMFERFAPIQSPFFKVLGFFIGLIGLTFCLYAQVKMGNSWRVGIDEKAKLKLIKTGLYSMVRNPTYLGMFILNLGIWLVLPTFAVFILNLIYIISIEFQVRCEEDFLEKKAGKEYLNYKSKTWRYIPYLY